MFADMIEAQEAPAARAIEIGRLDGRFELARLAAARDGATIGGALDAAVELGITRCHSSSLLAGFLTCAAGLYRRDERSIHRSGRE
jgi:hypothetical protein